MIHSACCVARTSLNSAVCHLLAIATYSQVLAGQLEPCHYCCEKVSVAFSGKNAGLGQLGMLSRNRHRNDACRGRPHKFRGLFGKPTNQELGFGTFFELDRILCRRTPGLRPWTRKRQLDGRGSDNFEQFLREPLWRLAAWLKLAALPGRKPVSSRLPV